MSTRTGIADADALDEPLEVRTYSQLAYDELRRRILDGRLPQGTKITVRVFAEELGLSPTPIKNALAALQMEGFLETVAYRGYSVPVITIGELMDAFEVLEALDVYAACKIAADPERAGVVGRLEELVRDGTRSAAPSEWSGYEMDFHKLIWASCGNTALAAAAERHRGLVLVASGGLIEPPARRNDVRAEHLNVIDAIARGDVLGVAEICSAHMRRSADVLAARLEAEERAR